MWVGVKVYYYCILNVNFSLLCLYLFYIFECSILGKAYMLISVKTSLSSHWSCYHYIVFLSFFIVLALKSILSDYSIVTCFLVISVSWNIFSGSCHFKPVGPLSGCGSLVGSICRPLFFLIYLLSQAFDLSIQFIGDVKVIIALYSCIYSSLLQTLFPVLIFAFFVLFFLVFDFLLCFCSL